jgi:hypothetical protein
MIHKKDSNDWMNEPETRAVFKEIDRDQEDKDVAEYLRTGNIALFDKIYTIRIPTIQIWAAKNHWLMESKEDLEGALNVCFMKAINTYKKGKGKFNNWLFTCFLNYLRNVSTGHKAKKRLPDGITPKEMKGMILSLNYKYKNGKDGSENTIEDIIGKTSLTKKCTTDDVRMKEIINILSNNDPKVAGFLKKLSSGYTIASLVKECKTKCGKVWIGKSLTNKLSSKSKKNCKRVIFNLIKEKAKIEDKFSVIDYSFKDGNQLYYTIEMEKTPEANLVLKTIRKLRKDEDHIYNKLA